MPISKSPIIPVDWFIGLRVGQTLNLDLARNSFKKQLRLPMDAYVISM